MRLHSYIKNYGNYTKKEVIELSKNHRIKVNGKEEILSFPLQEDDKVTVDDVQIVKKDYQYYIYNKPVGVLSSNVKTQPDSFVNQLSLEEKLFTVGRLDKESEGLMILTNDSRISKLVFSDEGHLEKEYLVETKDIITENFIEKMNEPHIQREKILKQIHINKVDNTHFLITLREGLYHQIRRMVITSGNRVVSLKRIRIGNIMLGDLEKGKRKVFPNMLEKLKEK